LNSSSNVQCHVPAGGATGGAVPAHGPLSAGAVVGVAVLGVAGSDAAVPGALRCVEEEIEDPPPDGAARSGGAAVVVLVVVELGHLSAI
jgi:hypothetical protein